MGSAIGGILPAGSILKRGYTGIDVEDPADYASFERRRKIEPTTFRSNGGRRHQQKKIDIIYIHIHTQKLYTHRYFLFFCFFFGAAGPHCC